MFIRIRLLAHEALRRYMSDNGDHARLPAALTARVYGIIWKAGDNDGFAAEFNNLCSAALKDATAEGYGELIELVEHPSPELECFFEKNNI